MAELLVIRHGQASFGAENYDKLSDLGHRQSAQLGAWLSETGWQPDRCITGTLTRQKETLIAMGFAQEPEEHSGFNEYDFHDLLRVRFPDGVPDVVMGDRKTHFRTLRDTVFEWQDGGLPAAKESWQEFTARVDEARRFAVDTEAKRVLVVSSGGAIGQLTASSLGAPDRQMMTLNLQVKNASLTKFVFSTSAFYLHEFNTTPHFSSAETMPLMSYS